MLCLDLNKKRSVFAVRSRTNLKKKYKKAANIEVGIEMVSSEEAHGFSKRNSSAAQWNTMQYSLL